MILALELVSLELVNDDSTWFDIVIFQSNRQGVIQKKSFSGSRTQPCLMIFFQNFILIWKCQFKHMCTMVLATVIHQTKWSFTVLSTLFCSSRHCPMILDYSIKDEISSYLFLNEIYCCTRQGISKQNLVSVFHLIHNQLFHPLLKSLKNIVFVFSFECSSF